MNALARQTAIVSLQDALGVALRNGGGVGVHGVQKKLYGDGLPALEAAHVVVGDHDSGVELVAAEGVAQLID